MVTGDHGAQRIAAGYGAMVLEDEEQGHNEAASLGVEQALELGAERVLLVPGDCPLLDPREIDELLGRPDGYALGDRSSPIATEPGPTRCC